MTAGHGARMDFQLDPRLAADTAELGQLPLCHAALMRDARYPWLILIPRRAAMREIVDLTARERAQLMDEITLCSKAMQQLFAPDKLNVGVLGNIVSQLHIHIIARNAGDAAWPGPVWGHGAPITYADDALDAMCAKLRRALAADFVIAD